MCFKYFFLVNFFEARRGDCRLTLEKKRMFRFAFRGEGLVMLV